MLPIFPTIILGSFTSDYWLIRKIEDVHVSFLPYQVWHYPALIHDLPSREFARSPHFPLIDFKVTQTSLESRITFLPCFFRTVRFVGRLSVAFRLRGGATALLFFVANLLWQRPLAEIRSSQLKV